jgi:ankyrin repeat protein
MSDSSIPDPNAIDKSGNPILFKAIKSMDLPRVKQLVEAGADIEKTGFGEQTAAMAAATADQWEICLYLLQQGADATGCDDIGMTIPYLAFNARTVRESHQGRFLLKVQEFLKKKGLDRLNIPPERVRKLKAAGAWPPATEG